MDVSVCFPYRSDEGSREVIKEWILARWHKLFPDFELCLGEPDTGVPFNRSQGINRAFKQSSGAIIIIADLDLMFNKVATLEAIEHAKAGGWAFGFSRYFKATQSMSEDILRMPVDLNPHDVSINVDNCEAWADNTSSGCVIISRENFEKVGGFDEDFIDWGYEDVAFTDAADYSVAPHFRPEYTFVIHLWHPIVVTYDSMVQGTLNKNLYESRYVNGDLSKLKKWI